MLLSADVVPTQAVQ
ncbi:hypothetical protein [Prosthecomicrobium hirschii]